MTKQYTERGFTLVELMIVMVVSIVVIGAIYRLYRTQLHSYTVQEEVAEMQQNIRAVMTIQGREIRMAGYDPAGSGATILSAAVNQLQFTMDINEDGDTLDPNENVIYGFGGGDTDSNGNQDNDNNADGIADAGIADFGRNTGGGYQAVAENIHAVEFLYTLLDGTQTTTVVSPGNIRVVTVSILARAGRADSKFLNTLIYCPASNPLNPATGLCTNPAPATSWGPYNDNFRRRLLISTFQCRNMGL